jgi:hypothetical protein
MSPSLNRFVSELEGYSCSLMSVSILNTSNNNISLFCYVVIFLHHAVLFIEAVFMAATNGILLIQILTYYHPLRYFERWLVPNIQLLYFDGFATAFSLIENPCR